PPSTGERLTRCIASAALPLPPLPPSSYPLPPVDRRDSIPRIQQKEIAGLRETDRVRQSQIVETLRVMRDMRREMGDMQAELLALRGQPRRAGQPEGNVRVPNHQDAPKDADSHI
nr:hypothetical protein [Tanacetum cinerariifolium]